MEAKAIRINENPVDKFIDIFKGRDSVKKHININISQKTDENFSLIYFQNQWIKVPAEDEWFWSDDWQQKEIEANLAIKENRTKVFDTMEDLISFLD